MQYFILINKIAKKKIHLFCDTKKGNTIDLLSIVLNFFFKINNIILFFCYKEKCFFLQIFNIYVYIFRKKNSNIICQKKFWNTLYGIYFNFGDVSICLKDKHPWKAFSPIENTEDGIFIFESIEQFSKVLHLIIDSLEIFSKYTLTNDVQL